MLTLVCKSPAPAALVLIESATGKVWLPASETFGAADGKAELIPTSAVVGTGPNIVGLSVAVVAAFPDTRTAGEYACSVHPANGGESWGIETIRASVTLIKIAVTAGP